MAVKQVPQFGDVIGWDRGDKVIPMYYKGQCNRPDEGIMGFDVRCRPVELGEGPYTVTVGGHDVIWDYKAVRP